MSTSANIIVFDEEKNILANISQHGDGYPSYIMRMLREFLDGKKITNGIPVGSKDGVDVFNGAGGLTAHLIRHITTEHGGIYLYPANEDLSWSNYTYELYIKKNGPTRESVSVLMNGVKTVWWEE